MLANDTDLDGSKSPVVSVSVPAHGTAAINGNGTIRYTPVANYSGSDIFTYTNAEGTIGSVTMTVNAVNDITTIVNDIVTVNEDNSIIINVLTNDTDIDTKSPVQSITQPTHGSAVLNGDGTITYTPSLNYSGTDVFMYTNVEGNSGTITVNVTAVNDSTVVLNDNVTLVQDTSTIINVIANDTDIDGPVAAVQSITQPAHGSAVLNGDGTVAYTPTVGYYGLDSFVYMNTNGVQGTVNITVTQYQGTPLYYGVYEYGTSLDQTKVLSTDFIPLSSKTDLAGQYVFNSAKYDSEDPMWPGTNSGMGAYHTLVYPKTWRYVSPANIIDDSNGFAGGWADESDIVINGTVYRVLRTSYEQYAGNYSYTVPA